MSRRAKIIWIVGTALLLVLLLVLRFIPYHGQICEPAGEAKVANCTSYQLLPFIVFEVAQFLDKMGGAITAVATIAIAIFTFTLKRATDKLWEAGERQLHLLGETSAAQSRDMQASIQAATDSANAAITSNQIAVTNAGRQLRAYVTVQDINMVTHRLADRVGTLHDNIVPGAVHTYRFSVILKNGGMTPAINARTNISHNTFNSEIPADFHFPDSTTFGNALIGPQLVWHTPSITIQAAELETPLVGALHYLWGWIEYDDIFSSTTRHRTEFCFKIECERLQPTNEFWVSFAPHSKFNAADEDCLRHIDPAG
ncbi:hypothetical protein [Bradyrhizobium sp. WSM471]|uniref:hypothetical protein n=1 Tax=Bradyrhizobium sp. WSM471 TaxID=319017 RepID=UPI0012FA6ECD|nr:MULTISPECIES: hypothetical protein [Bradyrhizobium]UFW43043.1 hypothetical protein BcanWSM471_08025 [Bradyrhizobium canariense]